MITRKVVKDPKLKFCKVSIIYICRDTKYRRTQKNLGGG